LLVIAFRSTTSHVFDHLTHRTIPTVYTRLMLLLVKYKPVVGMQHSDLCHIY